MLRHLILIGGAIAAVVWLAHQPEYLHATPHKQAVALIAITAPFLLLDIIVSARKRRRARGRSQQAPGGIRARAGAGR
jgi:hypothetical protein